MSERIYPPRLAVRLLERRLPAEITDAIRGDLEEEPGGADQESPGWT